MRKTLTWLEGFVLDFRLAVRLLGKYPFLTPFERFERRMCAKTA
jgi:hypothetical protein